jgi:serine protease Do
MKLTEEGPRAVWLRTAAVAAGVCLASCAPQSADAKAEPELGPIDLTTAPAAPQVATSGQASEQVEESRATAIVRATGRVAPAVVSVNVLRTRQIQPRTAWESLFVPRGAQRRSASFGSGVIVHEDGIVLTNDHVISGASRIRVTLSGGRDLEAEVIGTDPMADIAVLKIDGAGLPVAPVGSVRGLMIGEWAIAIGNPLGNYVGDTQPTVTAGVVSAVNRNIAPSSEDEGFYLGMIQTDASINPGNSGGPLVNAAGEVIGINASIISRSGGSEGLGFAIPIDRAMKIADDLVQHGEVRRAWVGLDVEPVQADEWGRTRGVRVSRVAAQSPADAAALEPGDRLVSANGRPLAGPLDWDGVLLDLRAGDRLEVEVEEGRRVISMEAVTFPSVTAARVTVLQDIELISVTPQIQLERGLVSADGALITGISRQLGGQLGLEIGDVIVQMNRVRIRSAEDAAQYFRSLRGSGRIVMYIERNGDLRTRNLYWRG